METGHEDEEVGGQYCDEELPPPFASPLVFCAGRAAAGGGFSSAVVGPGDSGVKGHSGDLGMVPPEDSTR